MKKLSFQTLTIFLLTLMSVACDAPKEQVNTDGLFEGVVTYDIAYEGNESNKDGAFKKLGKTSRYCFMKGNYYQDYDGQEMEYNLYLNEPNLYFTKVKGYDTLDVIDCNRDMASKHNIHVIRTKKTHEMVMGKDCQVLTVDYHEDGSFLKNIDFYYNSHVMPIDPAWEAHNPMYNASAVFAHSRALPLKIVYNYGDLSIIYTAREIKEQDLDSFFEETEKEALSKPRKNMN